MSSQRGCESINRCLGVEENLYSTTFDRGGVPCDLGYCCLLTQFLGMAGGPTGWVQDSLNSPGRRPGYTALKMSLKEEVE